MCNLCAKRLKILERTSSVFWSQVLLLYTEERVSQTVIYLKNQNKKYMCMSGTNRGGTG